MRYLDDEPLPGSDRVRPKYGAIPTLAGEITGRAAMKAADGKEMRDRFPFISWAVDAAFRYPKPAESFLCQCESAPEAFFAREFAARGGVVYRDGAAVYTDGTQVRLQVRRGFMRIDAVVTRGPAMLAVEIDGMSFHARKYDQVAADYLRERRLLALGYTVVRFTAQEVFADAAECWRQVDAILTAHAKAS